MSEVIGQENGLEKNLPKDVTSNHPFPQSTIRKNYVKTT